MLAGVSVGRRGDGAWGAALVETRQSEDAFPARGAGVAGGRSWAEEDEEVLALGLAEEGLDIPVACEVERPAPRLVEVPRHVCQGGKGLRRGVSGAAAAAVPEARGGAAHMSGSRCIRSQQAAPDGRASRLAGCGSSGSLPRGCGSERR